MKLDEAARALVAPSLGAPLEFRNVVLPDLRSDEVLVQIKAVGICHADVSCINGTIPVPFPHVLGHEGQWLPRLCCSD